MVGFDLVRTILEREGLNARTNAVVAAGRTGRVCCGVDTGGQRATRTMSAFGKYPRDSQIVHLQSFEMLTESTVSISSLSVSHRRLRATVLEAF